MTDSCANAQAPDSRPHFVDNRDGNTLDTALRAYLRALREGQQQFVFADVATPYFNLPGFDLLAEEFGKVALQVRLRPPWPRQFLLNNALGLGLGGLPDVHAKEATVPYRVSKRQKA